MGKDRIEKQNIYQVRAQHLLNNVQLYSEAKDNFLPTMSVLQCPIQEEAATTLTQDLHKFELSSDSKSDAEHQVFFPQSSLKLKRVHTHYTIYEALIAYDNHRP